MTDLNQQRSNQLELVVSQGVEWRFSECSDFSPKTSVSRRSMHWLNNIPDCGYGMKTSEHSKEIREKVIESITQEMDTKKI